MQTHRVYGQGRHARAVIAGFALAISIAGSVVADEQKVDQGDGATGAVQHGSNTALAGNGGGSTLNSEAAEISVGDILTGDGSTNEISLTSTIETQISSADGGDLNHAAVSDNDPVTDDRDVDIDDRETTTIHDRETTLNNVQNVDCAAANATDQEVTMTIGDITGDGNVVDQEVDQSVDQDITQDCDANVTLRP